MLAERINKYMSLLISVMFCLSDGLGRKALVFPSPWVVCMCPLDLKSEGISREMKQAFIYLSYYVYFALSTKGH